MVNYRKRLVVVISSLVFSIVVVCLSFDANLMHALGQSTAFLIVLASISALSIYFCYFTARRVSRYSLSLAVLAFMFLLSVIDIITLILNVDNTWTDGMTDAIEVLLPLSALIAVLQSRKKVKEEKPEPAGSSPK